MRPNGLSLSISLLCPILLTSATVVDDRSSTPLNHVDIRILNIETGAILTSVETTATGEFQLTSLLEGHYRLEMSKTGFIPITTNLNVPQESDLDAAAIFRLIRCGVISGKVLDAESNPIPTARVVILRRADRADLSDIATWEPIGAPSPVDRDGNYRVYGLTPDTYRVGAIDMVAGGHDLKGITLAPTEFTILGGDEYDNTRIQLASEEGFSISGHVQGGEGDAAILVSLVPDVEPGLVITAALARPDIGFQFDNVLPGDYRLLARRGNSKPGAWYGRIRVHVRATNVEAIEILLQPGRMLSIALHPVAPSDSSGRCSDPLNVTLYPVEGGPTGRSSASGPVYSKAATSFGPLELSTYRVTAVSTAGCESSGPRYLDLNGGSGPSVRELNAPLPAGSIRVHLKKSASSPHNLVVLLPFGCGNRDCKVRLEWPNDNGEVSFDNLPRGDYYVMVRRSTDVNEHWRPVPSQDPNAVTVEPGMRREVEVP